MSLNQEQSNAVDQMVDFLNRNDTAEPFFVLSGSAGTGKTYCIRQLPERIRGRFIYTAPTNKATKVLRDTLTTTDYKPQCKTIYSLLGLRLEISGEIKELGKPDEDIDLTQFRAVIVDEGSMLNSVVLSFMRQAAERQKIKFIIMGDPAQLNPVKEQISPVWKLDAPKAHLEKVMRYDNQILALATQLRGQVGHPAPKFSPREDNDGTEGIWYAASHRDFVDLILHHAGEGRFSRKNESKFISWRNATVDEYNAIIRKRLFNNASEQPWLPDDRLIVMAPANNLEGDPIASTDDEGTVTKIFEEEHPLFPGFNIRVLHVTTDDNRTIMLRALHESSLADYNRHCELLAAEARTKKYKWKEFWEFKEAFHSVRHGYAITAHRSQGSTYETTFVDWRDILLNRERTEAFRCLYVACTRAKKQLVLGA